MSVKDCDRCRFKGLKVCKCGRQPLPERREPALSAHLHRLADESNDSHDHDELHAAAAIVAIDWGDGTIAAENYVNRWIAGLLDLHGRPE